MNKDNNKKMISKPEISKMKKLVQIAKEKKLVKPHTEAFLYNPVKLESHKGNANYFLNK